MIKLKELRMQKGCNQTDVAKVLGITQQAYANYETEKRQPDNETLSKLADFFNVSVDYLLGRTDASSPDYAKYGFRPVTLKKFPMLGEIACGQPIYANQNYETFVEASSEIQADFCLTAKGDCMINARIFDGDIVFIRSQSDVDNGEIAAVIIDDEATLKRVFKYPSRLELRPENPTHPVLNYEGEELNHITILGKAVAFQSYIR